MSSTNTERSSVFPDAGEDAKTSDRKKGTPQTLSPSYILAYRDQDFLLRDELRPVRLQLEMLKPELTFMEQGINSTIVVFGSSRIPEPEAARSELQEAVEAYNRSPEDKGLARNLKTARKRLENSRFYEEARKFAQIASLSCKTDKKLQYVIITGGGPGIMEAANRGAYDVGALSIGLNIVIPIEQIPNIYITPALCFQFHYFGIRKLHFLMRAKALVIFPGGFGTLDELFDALTLIQTKKIKPIPVLLFSKSYWERVIDFPYMVEEGVISPEDIKIFNYVESAQEAWNVIKDFYSDKK